MGLSFLSWLLPAAKTLATGEGLVSARPDKEGHFEIVAHNRKGHRQRQGGDQFIVSGRRQHDH